MKGILSIQSQVVFGHVGHNAATFALQSLGHEVWPLPTVLLSNHPGHGGFTGETLPADRLRGLLTGLDARGVFANLTALHSGYLGAPDHADVVEEAVAKMRAAAPGALYCCDPVMGDAGKGTYVKSGLPEAIRGRLVPLADLIKPNAYELGLLTGCKIDNPRSVITAARSLPVPVTVCSSVPLPDDPGSIGAMAVTREAAWLVTAPRLAAPPPGTGDLFTALILGHVLNGLTIEETLARAASSLDKILTRTKSGDQELPLVKARGDLTGSAHLTVEKI